MLKTITYDSDCNFCRGVVRFLKKRDRKGLFRFVALQSGEGSRLLAEAGLPERDRSTVIYHSGGNIYLRSSAVLHILKDTHSGWSAAYILIIIPRFIRDRAYRLVARYRNRLAGQYREE